MVRALTALLGGCLLCSALQASEDIAGGRDPAGISRYPRAWIVDYALQSDAVPREFVVSRVDRIRRDLHVEGLLRAEATAETATYRIPDGTPLAEVVSHYREAFGGEVLFSCSGRGCGRSNDWANQIFGRAILYGPDGNQHYLAVSRDGLLLSAYVIERGNRRIYAHVQALTPVQGAAAAEERADSLLGSGWLVIPGLQPDAGGSLPADADAALRTVVPALAGAGAGPAYVVCHLYASAAAEELLAASSLCAEQAADRLSSLLLEAGVDAVALRAFGAGPLLPRSGGAANRIELVLPAGSGPPAGGNR